MKNKLIMFGLIFCIVLSFVTAESAYGDKIEKEGYSISRNIVNRTIGLKMIFEDSIVIKNKQDSKKIVSITATGEIANYLSFNANGVVIEPQKDGEFKFKIYGKDQGIKKGEIITSGDISEKIPIEISILKNTPGTEALINLETTKKTFTLREEIEVVLKVDKLVSKDIGNITFIYSLEPLEINSENILLSPKVITDNNLLLQKEPEIIEGENSFQIKKVFGLTKEVKAGNYVLNVVANYGNVTASASTAFELVTPFIDIKLFGIIPIWLLLVGLGVIGLGLIIGAVIRAQLLKRKKYKMELFVKTLPKKGERSLLLGKVAEKNLPAFLEMDRLTTHAVVAGATGGGKSIAAQVLIEEALIKNISVIVFDPTAQWSGMLRKCDDKKMLSYYKNFNLKTSEARAFPGNVRQIQNARQVIEIEKYIQPGHIQIFTLNKLDPSQMDTFVESVIASIFRSDPKEYPGLKTILVFDEVHRLLPKFGGSGKGFLQIERACREFRKWGLGVMLVSQVLSDFVGEIKANINTEVQMRTRDEADLDRLKTKYGEEVLQSLIKASVGVGMFVNPAYNKGKPYFINFRPILHNTRRLSDEILDKYNAYGESIEELEYQIEQLEQEKIDTFDMKMELKLVKDKLMTGNFTVVDIYLEGLKPRIGKVWDKIGKKPKKKELKLISEEEVAASLATAQKDRDKWAAPSTPKPVEKTPETVNSEKKVEQ